MNLPTPGAGERATQARYNLMQVAAEMEDVIRLGAGDPDSRHTSRDYSRCHPVDEEPTRGSLRQWTLNPSRSPS